MSHSPFSTPRTAAAAMALATGVGLVGSVLTAAAPARSAPNPTPTPATATPGPTTSATASPGKPAKDVDPTSYKGGPQVVKDGSDADTDELDGVVFDDKNRNSTLDADEKGIEGVAVSNGREVVRTDAKGAYKIKVQDKDTVFVSKPAGWDTPVDANNVTQFFYHHAPNGTHEQKLRFGGLKPTGPLPDAVNFPLAANPNAKAGDAKCLVLGDVQTYSNNEISHARNGGLRDASNAKDVEDCGALMLGDIAGDDLGMYPRLKQSLAGMGKALHAVPGNHDYDIDATNAKWSFDTYRQAWGPDNYSFEVGDMHVLAMNNVKYPCTKEMNTDGKRKHCDDPVKSPKYSGELGAQTLEWIKQDLANVPKNKKVVIATHIPMVSHADAASTQHQTYDLTELNKILEGRPVTSMSGHTHSLENMVAGDSIAEWKDAVGLDKLPYDNIVVGAVSGDWYSGDVNLDGVPNAIQRDGALPGFFIFDLGPKTNVATFTATGRPGDQMGLGVSTPFWRTWAQTLLD